MSNQKLSAQKLVCFGTKNVHKIDKFFMLLIAFGKNTSNYGAQPKSCSLKDATELPQKCR
jgi:hypothetical protein